MTIHRMLLAILSLGLVGTGAELLLLQHTEGLWELIPLALIGLTLIILAWHVTLQRPASVRALQGAMVLFVIAGFAGLVLHYQSNVEFKLETNRSLEGWALIWAALSGKAPPALAPGSMIQLGLLGLAYAYKRPALFITNMLKKKEKKMKYSNPKLFIGLSMAACYLNIASPSVAQVGRQQGMVEPNVADEKELLKLPHLNAAVVKGILERRPFANMTELNKFLIPSLDNKQLSELYTKMLLPINLNTATREEIMLIPGMGNRMVREFLEYRPYTAITQFRKEIGKYVDEREVARLEQYVFVPINLNSASDETLLSIPGATPQVLRTLKDRRPYKKIQDFQSEIAEYISAKEVGRLERYLTIN